MSLNNVMPAWAFMEEFDKPYINWVNGEISLEEFVNTIQINEYTPNDVKENWKARLIREDDEND